MFELFGLAVVGSRRLNHNLPAVVEAPVVAPAGVRTAQWSLHFFDGRRQKHNVRRTTPLPLVLEIFL